MTVWSKEYVLQMKKKSTLFLVQIAVLVAIILLMSFTPIGYLKVGPLSIALVTIPVVIGAMVLGPVGGLILGTVFGVTSFVQCFGMDAFGTMLFSISPVATFITCIPTRMLMGWLTGVIFKALYKADRTKTWCYFASGFIGALLNTLFFMTCLVVFFYHTDYIQGFVELLAAKSVLGFVVLFVGVNGAVEWPCCAIIGGGIAKILSKVIRRTSDGEYVES